MEANIVSHDVDNIITIVSFTLMEEGILRKIWNVIRGSNCFVLFFVFVVIAFFSFFFFFFFLSFFFIYLLIYYYFCLVGDMSTDCHDLLALAFGIIGRLYSVTVALLGHFYYISTFLSYVWHILYFFLYLKTYKWLNCKSRLKFSNRALSPLMYDEFKIKSNLKDILYSCEEEKSVCCLPPRSVSEDRRLTSIVCGRVLHDTICDFLVFWLQIAIEPFVVFSICW